MRPKLVAIKVSGGHLVPVIVRASGRGRRAPRFRGSGHRQGSRPLRRRPSLVILDCGAGRWPRRRPRMRAIARPAARRRARFVVSTSRCSRSTASTMNVTGTSLAGL